MFGKSPIDRILLDVINKSGRLVEPNGDHVKKVSFEEWQRMKGDREFVPLERYVNDLFFKTDGSQRQRPLRQLVQNEVGMFRGKIIFLKDAGPGDVGEGKYYQVPVAIGGNPTEPEGSLVRLK